MRLRPVRYFSPNGWRTINIYVGDVHTISVIGITVGKEKMSKEQKKSIKLV